MKIEQINIELWNNREALSNFRRYEKENKEFKGIMRTIKKQCEKRIKELMKLRQREIDLLKIKELGL
jgi:hypothetical protein